MFQSSGFFGVLYLPVRVDEVNDADGGADEEAERPGDEHAPEAPTHLELEHDILEDIPLELKPRNVDNQQ